MCGIVGGFWPESEAEKIKDRMHQALALMRHRGPDDQGFDLHAPSHGLTALGHTRLSIIDISSAGHQPMHSGNGRYTIVFNGEIYNYRELREEMKGLGAVFTSDSDTEVLLEAWALWGTACLPRLTGMFAFVVYDRKDNTLTCVRDAFGIKPLFYEKEEGHFLFASELPALLALRQTPTRPNWQRCYDYLVHGDYDSAEASFIEGIQHLMPGHLLTISLKTPMNNAPMCWWKPELRPLNLLDFNQASEALRALFLDNVRLHLRSDVPLGVALSGGIDSSAVVCAIRHLEPDMEIHTFSYIAGENQVSEASWIDRVNGFVNARSHTVTPTQENLAQDLDAMIRAQGEPFNSTSIYAQYRVFQLAREHGVTVTLDGQGADELLAGYAGYPGYRIRSLVENGQFLAAHHFTRNWSQWPGRSYGLGLMLFGRLMVPDALYATARKLYGRDAAPSWLKADLLQEAGVRLCEHRLALSPEGRGQRVREHLTTTLQHRCLPALLRHGDRNAMRFSVESRVPFLTIPMAEFLLSLPESYLISHEGQTKSLFRAAMRGLVPDEILDRKDKIGFETPEKKWLMAMQPTIRRWLEDAPDIPFIDKKNLFLRFDAVMAGKKNFDWQTWRWINFVRWYQLFISP